MIYYVIPARKGSKGLPIKNRILFDQTARTVGVHSNRVIVTTDDPEIVSMASDYRFRCTIRPGDLSNDTASMKHVLLHASQVFKMKDDDQIVLLYLTYPNRTWKHIHTALSFKERFHAKSCLCKYEVEDHPYMCLRETGDHTGEQLISHDLCRRQDYPKVFCISHFVGVFDVAELDNLNRNLYNSQTVYMMIDKPIDVDTLEDLDKWKK